jgi:hypothetical protein
MANVSIGGAAQFIVGGQLISIGEKVDVTPGGWSKVPVSSTAGPTGFFTEKWVTPEADVECLDDPSVSVMALQQVSSVTVQLNGKNGKSYLLYNAFATNADGGKVDMISGKYSLKLSGSRCIEQTAS